jgi:hypothetical protein
MIAGDAWTNIRFHSGALAAPSVASLSRNSSSASAQETAAGAVARRREQHAAQERGFRRR